MMNHVVRTWPADRCGRTVAPDLPALEQAGFATVPCPPLAPVHGKNVHFKCQLSLEWLSAACPYMDKNPFLERGDVLRLKSLYLTYLLVL
jgi:hypothetical protein